MKKLFLAAAGAFGAIPGLVVIQQGIGTPPGYNVLFGGVIEAFGALALCLLMVNSKKIKKLNQRKVIRISIRLGILCFVSLALYLVLYNHSVVTHDARGAAYYPLWLSGEIADMVNSAGSRWGAIEEYGIGAVVSSVAKMPSLARSITTVVLLFVYQTVFTSLTLAFGMAGVHKESAGEDTETVAKVAAG